MLKEEIEKDNCLNELDDDEEDEDTSSATQSTLSTRCEMQLLVLCPNQDTSIQSVILRLSHI